MVICEGTDDEDMRRKLERDIYDWERQDSTDADTRRVIDSALFLHNCIVILTR